MSDIERRRQAGRRTPDQPPDDDLLAIHPTILFVSHSGLFDALHERIFGERIEAKHAAPYHWTHGETGWRCEPV